MRTRTDDTIVDLPVASITHDGIRQAAEEFFALDAERRIAIRERDAALERRERAGEADIADSAARILAGKKVTDPSKHKREAEEAVTAAQDSANAYNRAMTGKLGELRGIIRANRKEWRATLLVDALAARDKIASATRQIEVALGEYQAAAGLLEMLVGDGQHLTARSAAGVVELQTSIGSLREGIAAAGKRAKDIG